MHPYLGKFIPQLVEIFLRKYFKAGQTVLDPFVGSGTTLVQANELEINSIGYDISVFNTLLCNAKTAQYDLTRVRSEVLDALDKLSKSKETKEQQLHLWENTATYDTTLSYEDSVYLRTWFAPQALTELIKYKDLINSDNLLNFELITDVTQPSGLAVAN